MALRSIFAAMLAALVLAACGGAAVPPSQPATFAGQPPATALPATSAPLPSAASPATAVPTIAPSTNAPAPTTLPEPTAVPAATAQASLPGATPAAATTIGSELLFLRKGNLLAFDLSSGQDRQIAEGVHEFAATADGNSIALVRGQGRSAEIWLVKRDGSGMTQLTHNDRAEASVGWAPDGQALIFAASTSEQSLAHEWQSWAAWCAGSEVFVLELQADAEHSFGPGCDPAFSPDGKRIAYATPPSANSEGVDGPSAANAIRLINRQGQNGWNFAVASGDASDTSAKGGLLVFAPAWSPDGKQLIYQRFLGYHALTDLAITEIGGSFVGKGQPLNVGAGWVLTPRFAPSGQSVALIENNPGDARGFGGYDNWSVELVSFDGSREIPLPTGTITAVGQSAGQLPRAQAAAWSPDGTALAVLLPPGWNAGLSADQPVNADGQAGEIWHWQPGGAPQSKLVDQVDFASPVLWLPAA